MSEPLPPEVMRRLSRGDSSTVEQDFLRVYLAHFAGIRPITVAPHSKAARDADFAQIVADVKQKTLVACDVLGWLEWEWPSEKQSPPYKFAQGLRERAELARSITRTVLKGESQTRYQIWGFRPLRDRTELALASLGEVPGVEIEQFVGPKAIDAIRRAGRAFEPEDEGHSTNSFMEAVWLLEKAGWKPPRDQ